MANPWLILTLIFLGIWFLIYLAKPALRKQMFWVSLFTMPFGLLEPFFIPEYWNPPSLFNLAARTGFDIEALIFCFAIGGVGAVIYETVLKVKTKKPAKKHICCGSDKFHKLTLISPVILFFALYFLTDINNIYSLSIAFFLGSISTTFCRPDLKKPALIGGLLFLAIYFIFFSFTILLFPTFVVEVWNLEAISGILIVGIPLEELMFAFTFGMMWSVLYEHVKGYKIRKK